MPLYEYQCARCGRFEVIRKFSDAPLAACPTCEGEVQKLLSAPAIQFKGTGWYVTDYARKSSDGESKTDGRNDAKNDSKNDAKNDAKTDGAGATATASSEPASSSPPQSTSKDSAATGSSSTK